MTIQKAIKMLDWWIDQRKTSMQKMKQEWSYTTQIEDVAKLMLQADETVIHNLEMIKAELIPKCKHPKKMIDTLPNGKKYCMNCNFDL